MRGTLNFWILGGDLRQEKLAGLLLEDGHWVHTYALAGDQLPNETDLSGMKDAHCVVLPLPVSTQEGFLNTAQGRCPLEKVLDQISPGSFLCGGRVDERTQALAAQRGLTIHDYFHREELAVANAVPGALAV